MHKPNRYLIQAIVIATNEQLPFPQIVTPIVFLDKVSYSAADEILEM